MTSTIQIVHPVYNCGDCAGPDAQLYHFGYNDGHNVSIAHGCEHFIRSCYPDVPAEWLLARAAPHGADCTLPNPFYNAPKE
jgi:hypothetical protein